MAVTDERPPPTHAEADITRRVQRLVADGTTELAPSVLRVPLTYYRDPDLLERERAVLLRTPLALAETARIPAAPTGFARASTTTCSSAATSPACRTSPAVLPPSQHHDYSVIRRRR